MRFVLLCLFLSNSLFAQQASSLRNSIVKVFVHKQEMNMHEPWKNGRIYTEEHVGTVVSFNDDNEKGILIKATALAFQKRIEMQMLSKSDLIELIPRFVDYEINLALLESSQAGALDDLRSTLISDQELRLEEETYLYKIDNGNHIDRLHGSLRRVNIGERTDTSSYPILNYVFKFPRKELGWSEPILSKGRLVALAVGEDDEDNVHAIPSTLITHFLNDDLSEDYQGFPTLGLKLASLSSPHTREALGIEKSSDGVLVLDVSADSAFYGKLKKGDVLLSIEGKAINNDGNFTHPVWGEVPALALLYKRYAGEKISIQVLKDQKHQKLIGELKRYNSNKVPIPYYQYTGKVPFLIVGGLVFQELTRPFLRAWGNNWLGDAPSSLIYHWRYQNLMRNNPEEHTIIVSQVLADQANKAYEGISSTIVKSVNHKPIHSLSDLKEALRSPIFKNKEYFIQVQLDYGEGEVILAMNELEKASERIASNYGIYDKSAFFIPVKAPPVGKTKTK